MWNCVTSVMDDPCTLRGMLSAEGVVDFRIAAGGRCHAKLTQVTLDDLHIAMIEETLPRIAFIKVPADRVLISLPLSREVRLFWGSINAQANELVTLGSGGEVHTRTDAPCRWGNIWLSVEDLARYTRALLGRSVIVPALACVWRPPSGAVRALRHAYSQAIRAAQTRPEAIGVAEAAHGLEQQLLHATIACLAEPPCTPPNRASQRRQNLMSSLERLVADLSDDGITVAALSRALGVSDRTLRHCCKLHLGMSPLSYLRLRRRRSVECAPTVPSTRIGTPAKASADASRRDWAALNRVIELDQCKG